MRILTLDWETFYDAEYSLSYKGNKDKGIPAVTTESYIRDPRFESILLGFKEGDSAAYWVPKDDIARLLRELKVEECGVVMHHAHFDAFIMNYHYGIKPKVIFDTLSMARGLHGANGGLSLDKLAQRYGLGAKGHAVQNYKGKRFADFAPAELSLYGMYCQTDVNLTWALFNKMLPEYMAHGTYELEVIDKVIRMFTEPMFEADVPLLQQYAQSIRAEKNTALVRAGVSIDELMSGDKFAQALENLGIEPPTKISPSFLKKPLDEQREHIRAHGKAPRAWAFSKTDAGMQALQEHPDIAVQYLVEARLKNKTTIAEKGAERLIGMASRGPITIYQKYSGAASHRLSSGDGFNANNMKRGSDIRKSLKAPAGMLCVAGDSSNIEARLLDWLAMQDDMVEVFRKNDAKLGPDVYCVMAGRIYGRSIDKEKDPDQRFVGKTAVLGLGYMAGAETLQRGIRNLSQGKMRLPIAECHNIVSIYRAAHSRVLNLWKRADNALKCIAQGQVGLPVDPRGVVKTCQDGLVFPGGVKILYPGLKQEFNPDTGRDEWTFWNGRAREHIYGGKVVENICQCLGRQVVIWQSMQAAKEVASIGWDWKHSVYDEAIYLGPAFYAAYVSKVLLKWLRTAPAWCPDLPLNGEVGFHERYGLAKK